MYVHLILWDCPVTPHLARPYGVAMVNEPNCG
jgi:hypothetical protein